MVKIWCYTPQTLLREKNLPEYKKKELIDRRNGQTNLDDWRNKK